MLEDEKKIGQLKPDLSVSSAGSAVIQVGLWF
jgi:hypothetical protein